MHDTILFDLDGTLTDPGEGITNSVAYALKQFNIEVSDKKELYKFIGPPLKDSFAKYYSMNDEECDRAVAEYRVYFKERGMFENMVYNGVKEVLQKLKECGKKLVIATSKPEEFAIQILKHFDLFDFFDYVCGATMDGRISAKADVVRYALEKSEISDKAKAIMVGDRMHDVIGAKENGISSVGVTYGYGSFDELQNAGADFIVDKIEEILKIVL